MFFNESFVCPVLRLGTESSMCFSHMWRSSLEMSSWSQWCALSVGLIWQRCQLCPRRRRASKRRFGVRSVKSDSPLAEGILQNRCTEVRNLSEMFLYLVHIFFSERSHQTSLLPLFRFLFKCNLSIFLQLVCRILIWYESVILEYFHLLSRKSLDLQYLVQIT